VHTFFTHLSSSFLTSVSPTFFFTSFFHSSFTHLGVALLNQTPLQQMKVTYILELCFTLYLLKMADCIYVDEDVLKLKLPSVVEQLEV
jgi:hypothetical protein